MATVPEEKCYQGRNSGKFRKRPFRRTQTTSPTVLRNTTRNNGWLSKFVHPAQRLITYSAHRLLSVLRKRLAPPPFPFYKIVIMETRHNPQKAAIFATNESSGEKLGLIGESGDQINLLDRVCLPQLQKLFKHKTFTRVDVEDGLSSSAQNALGNGILSGTKQEGLKCRSSVLSNDIGYYGQIRRIRHKSNLRSSKRLAMTHSDSPLSLMSVVPRAANNARVFENGFLTPRVFGRSAIYKMARTPYSRVYPDSTLKGAGVDVVDGPSSSSTQRALVHGIISGTKQGGLKRRSSVLGNDIGYFGRTRQVHFKSNLQSSKVIKSDTAQLLSLSMQKKPILPGEVKHSRNTMPSSRFPPLPPKSTEMASKILQQLDNMVSSEEKTSVLRLPNVNDKSSTKLSSSMLRGQSLCMKTVDSSKMSNVENGLKPVSPNDELIPAVTN